MKFLLRAFLIFLIGFIVGIYRYEFWELFIDWLTEEEGLVLYSHNFFF